MKLALYPGTFDPVTNGHLDILQRACRIFDKVVVAIAPNPNKKPLFTLEERVAFFVENISGLNVEVTTFNGLIVDYARQLGAVALIRGLRAVSDFEFEFQMTQMNRDLDASMETIFLMPSARYFFTSSTLVKQVGYYEADRVSKFVPPNVAEALKQRYVRSQTS